MEHDTYNTIQPDAEGVEPTLRDAGATTAELAVWVVLGLAFVGTVFGFASPVAGQLGERITGLIP